VVKVAMAADGSALYFSRAPIPHVRDADDAHRFAHRHLGIYAYRVAALKRLTALPVSRLEGLEKLEQLRALEAGMRIAVAVAAVRPGIGIDTPADIERVRGILGTTPAR
jgi:3-deoxy-manno-octulosonate cytidylyltransferase (CMP-KDO synthetase)